MERPKPWCGAVVLALLGAVGVFPREASALAVAARGVAAPQEPAQEPRQEPVEAPEPGQTGEAGGGREPGAPQDPAAADVPPPPSQFARFVPIGDDEGRFEVSICGYRRPDGAEVSLIAAVHIADAAHYADLRREFERYGVVLYELVAEAGHRPERGKRGRASGITLLQLALKTGLQLQFQLDGIDYTAANFVHADLTPREFTAKMEERGETFLGVFLSLISREMRRLKDEAEAADEEAERRAAAGLEPDEESDEGKESDDAPDLVSAFQAGYGRHAMRLSFAKQLERIEYLAAGGDEGSGTVLLEGRNERALEVLGERLAAGDRNLAIYYGAAHMPGIERALVEEMGFSKVSERWLTAWDVTKRPDRADEPGDAEEAAEEGAEEGAEQKPPSRSRRVPPR